LLFALCLLNTGIVRADSDAVKNCIANWVTSCSKECATAKCVSNCTTQAHERCTLNVVNPQMVFSGPVTSTFTDQCVPPEGAPACAPLSGQGTIASAGAACSVVSGTVADHQFWGGTVTIYIVCPAGSPPGNSREVTSVTIIASATSSCADGKFSMTGTNACAGQTGCYGLIAVTPPPGSCSPTLVGDPGWSTCTGAICPSP
jgi:hypothetical protein